MSLVADYSSDVSSSDEEITSTEIKTETPKKTSISSLLPPPKALSKSKKDGALKTTNFMPHAITRKKPVMQAKSDTKNEDDTEDVNTITEAFFPLGPEITNIKSINETKDASAASVATRDNIEPYAIAGATDISFPTDGYTYNEYYNDGQWQENANAYEEYQGMYDEPQQKMGSEQAQLNWELDDEMKLGGRRGKKEGPIKIKEINAADQMADSWQYQVANLSKPTRGSSEGSARLKPTRGQKRKHNLMYLAFHATAMESELKEQHASNRKTKRETQAKY
ncbi:17527_t:CDS:2, partial [Racocetra fulgida]